MKTFLRFSLAALALRSLLSVALQGIAAEPQPLTVAVVEFDSPYKVMRHDVSDLLVANLSAEPQFVLVERKDLAKVLAEQTLGAAASIDSDSALRIGQLTGAKILVTGRVFKVGEEWTISTRVTGTDTGRMYSETVQGARSNLVNVVSNLSQKIVSTVALHRTNLVASPGPSRDERIAKLAKQLGNRQRPSVELRIIETSPGSSDSNQTTETELGLVLQKTGFTVVGKNSETKPDIIVTGSATASKSARTGELFTCSASLDVQVEERASGKRIATERQTAYATDIGVETAAKLALESAADSIAERLLPKIIK